MPWSVVGALLPWAGLVSCTSMCLVLVRLAGRQLSYDSITLAKLELLDSDRAG
jgi:hypothetical protein